MNENIIKKNKALNFLSKLYMEGTANHEIKKGKTKVM